MTIDDLMPLVQRLREYLTLAEPREDLDPEIVGTFEALVTGLREHEAFDQRVAEQIGEVCAAITQAGRKPDPMVIEPLDPAGLGPGGQAVAEDFWPDFPGPDCTATEHVAGCRHHRGAT